MVNLAPQSVPVWTQIQSACATTIDTIRASVADLGTDMKIVGLATKTIQFLRKTESIAPDACEAFLSKAKPFTDFGDFFDDLQGVIGSVKEGEEKEAQAKSYWSQLKEVKWTKPITNFNGFVGDLKMFGRAAWREITEECGSTFLKPLSNWSWTILSTKSVADFLHEIGMIPELGIIEKIGKFSVLGKVIKLVEKVSDSVPFGDLLLFFGFAGAVEDLKLWNANQKKATWCGLVRDQLYMKKRLLEEIERAAKDRNANVKVKTSDIALMNQTAVKIKEFYATLAPAEKEKLEEDNALIESLYTTNGVENAPWNQVAAIKMEGNEKALEINPQNIGLYKKFYSLQTKRWTNITNEAQGKKDTGRIKVIAAALSIGGIALGLFGPMTGITFLAKESTFVLFYGVCSSGMGVVKQLCGHYYAVNADSKPPKNTDKVLATIVHGMYKPLPRLEPLQA